MCASSPKACMWHPRITLRSQVARLEGNYFYHEVILLTPQPNVIPYSTGSTHKENDRRPLLLIPELLKAAGVKEQHS